MVTCAHLQWLDLTRRDAQWSVTHGKRLRQLARTLSAPKSQVPFFLFFVGTRNKVTALRTIFPENNITRRQAHGIANVHVDVFSTSSTNPIFIADCSPAADAVDQINGWTGCHETVRHRLEWLSDDFQDVSVLKQKITSRVLINFIDIVCIFVEDLGGIQKCHDMLTQWASYRESQHFGQFAKPRVILVGRAVIDPAWSQIWNLLQSTFSKVEYFQLKPVKKLPRVSNYQLLREHLLQDKDDILEYRTTNHTNFTALHVAALFEKAIAHFATEDGKSFNLLRATRPNPYPHYFTTHISQFLELSLEHTISVEDYSSFIASAILLDSNPPSSHYFEPHYVFQELYSSQCREAAETIPALVSSESLDAFVSSVEEQFVRKSYQLHVEGLEAAVLRRGELADSKQHWSSMKSTLTCFFCLRRAPEHVLGCGHAWCETCVVINSSAELSIGYRFCVPRCDICLRRVNAFVTIKPPTAAPCILTVDGGGVKGIVPLGFLRALQKSLGPAVALVDYFDCAFATSSGSFTIIDLFDLRTNLEDCIERFKNFASQIFPLRAKAGRSCCSRLHEAFNWWFSDCRYDPEILESVLRKAFGAHRRLFDVHKGDSTGFKLGITATTTTDARLCIFTNYNGQGQRSRSSGYTHLRPRRARDEPYLWEVQRQGEGTCVTEDKLLANRTRYFPPKRLNGLHPLQDGGVRANNPLQEALWELEQIWPAASEPAVAVSIGTGFASEETQRDFPTMRGILRDGFIPRLFRSLMSSPSIDGQKSWVATMNNIPKDRRRCFRRLNLPMKQGEVGLNDAKQIPFLESELDDYLLHHDATSEIAHALWAASFFLELEATPEFEHGLYTCRGVVLCNRPKAAMLAEHIFSQYPAAAFVTGDGQALGLLSDNGGCKACHQYAKKVSLETRLLTEPSSIYLKFTRELHFPIGGFPKPISWFNAQQGFDDDFGYKSPYSTIWQNCPHWRPSRKRRHSDLENDPSKKPRVQ